MVHEDNAVAYYRHLREQGVHPESAIEHTMQRFGVSKAVLVERIDGFVADPIATQTALADARRWLDGIKGLEHNGSEVILRDLYKAVTGEKL